MGCVESISARGFPKQGKWLGLRTEVCFHYDTSQMIGGTVVRDDHAPPYVTIIQLDDGRFVLGTECQHSPARPTEEERHKAKVGEALDAVNAEHGENLRRLAEDDGA